MSNARFGRLILQIATSAICLLMGSAATVGFLATFEPAPAGAATAFLLWRLGYACIAGLAVCGIVLTLLWPVFRSKGRAS